MVRKRKKSAHKSDKIVFRSGVRLGFADAEDDIELLQQCYVDTGQVTQVLDPNDPGSVVLGRTGAGKTAALIHLSNNNDHCIQVQPEDLALNYISNSNIISFFHGIGVDLDLFFQLLWRHIFCVELVNYHYNVRSRSAFQKIFSEIESAVGDNKSKRLALNYFSTWGTNFWEETQQRIREIVEKFEGDLRAGIDLTSLGVPINAQGSEKISEEQRNELINHGKHVVNKIQIKSLSELMNILKDDIFKSNKKPYYIVIDRLDENWVEDDLRYRLIRALIETVKAFRKIRNVKIVVALRVDLLERVYRYTRSGGFQEEKYEDLNVPIKWNRDQLFDLVNKRITEVFVRQYTKSNVKYYDIFPKKYRQEGDSFDHIVNRTQFRPRDIIAFVNQIFLETAGQKDITANIIDRAEGEYSKKRLQALCTEWRDEHPYLEIGIE